MIEDYYDGYNEWAPINVIVILRCQINDILIIWPMYDLC